MYELERSMVMSEQKEKEVVNTTEEIEVEVNTDQTVSSDNMPEEKRYPSYKERKRLKQEERTKKFEEEKKLMGEIAVAQAELNELKKEYGIEAEEKGVKKWITNYFDRRESRKKVLVDKKKYIIMTVLFGWMGAHRFYTKQYVLGLIYLATCWTGFPVSLVVIDLLIAIPIQPDEEGKILI